MLCSQAGRALPGNARQIVPPERQRQAILFAQAQVAVFHRLALARWPAHEVTTPKGVQQSRQVSGCVRGRPDHRWTAAPRAPGLPQPAGPPEPTRVHTSGQGLPPPPRRPVWQCGWPPAARNPALGRGHTSGAARRPPIMGGRPIDDAAANAEASAFAEAPSPWIPVVLSGFVGLRCYPRLHGASVQKPAV